MRVPMELKGNDLRRYISREPFSTYSNKEIFSLRTIHHILQDNEAPFRIDKERLG